MKTKLLFFTCIALTFASCQKDIKAEQIEAKIIEQAMGNDLNYKPVSTEKVAEITYQDIGDSFFATVGKEPTSLPAFYKKMDGMIENFRKKGDSENYHYGVFFKGRVKKYEAAKDKNAIAYRVFKHTYTISSPMFDNAQVTVNNYYFFDANDQLITYYSESEFEDYKRTYIKHSATPYETMLFKSQL